MSQRNPMNDRYTADGNKGKTRKSAAKAKPKTRAASTVRIQSTTPTKKEKKMRRKQEQAKRTEIDRKYYNPPTPEYKKWKKAWWICLISGIVLIAGSTLIRFQFPQFETVSYIMLGLAYVVVIGALVLDFTKIRKIRRAYQEKMASQKSKEDRAAEKERKAAELAAKKAAEEAAEKGEDQKEAPKQNSIIAKLMGKGSAKAKETITAEPADTKEADEAKATGKK